jgi:hypothetical protein
MNARMRKCHLPRQTINTILPTTFTIENRQNTQLGANNDLGASGGASSDTQLKGRTGKIPFDRQKCMKLVLLVF